MAEQRLERDLRAGLAADLDPVHGPHPRLGRRARRRAGRAPPAVCASRWRTAALLVAAAVGVVAIAVLARRPPTCRSRRRRPRRRAVAAHDPPAATPTTGEIALGRVAVATAFGEPALLVRVSDAVPARDLETGEEGVSLLVEVRVVGPLDREVGVDRFVVLRAGRPEPECRIWVGGVPVGLPDPVRCPVGTQASARTAVFFDPDETVDLGYAGSGSSVTFRYPVHRPPPVPSLEGRCPTLEDYSLASLQPSAEPAPPSFDPVAPERDAVDRDPGARRDRRSPGPGRLAGGARPRLERPLLRPPARTTARTGRAGR